MGTAGYILAGAALLAAGIVIGWLLARRADLRVFYLESHRPSRAPREDPE